MFSLFLCCWMPPSRGCDVIGNLAVQTIDARLDALQWCTYFAKFKEKRNNLPDKVKNELNIIIACYGDRAIMIRLIEKLSSRFNGALKNLANDAPNPADPIYIQTVALQTYYDELDFAIENMHSQDDVMQIIEMIAEEENKLLLKTSAAVEQTNLYLNNYSVHKSNCPICLHADQM